MYRLGYVMHTTPPYVFCRPDQPQDQTPPRHQYANLDLAEAAAEAAADKIQARYIPTTDRMYELFVK